MNNTFKPITMKDKELIIEKQYRYYYKDLKDGLTYRVSSCYIADITFNICRLPFSKCDFSKRVEVNPQTLSDI